MRYQLFMGVAVLALGPTVALAGGVHNWTGVYVGVHAGSASATYTSAQTADGDPTGTDVFAYPGGTGNGLFGGLQGGYNHQAGTFLFGIEGDLGRIGIHNETTLLSKDTGGTDVSSVDYGTYGLIAGRVGVALDRLLAYGKGGIAFASIDNRTFETSDGTAIEAGEDHNSSGTKRGWAFGGGLEYLIHDNWSAKVEFLRMDFGTASVQNLEGDTIEFRNLVDTVKFGVNLHF